MITITNNTIGEEEVNAVDARELWVFLESKQQFSHWVQNKIEKYEFVQGADFITIDNFNYSPPRKEYTISMDMAKELSMVENNEKGKQARKYFIKCEKLAKKQLTPAEHLLENAKRLVAQERKMAAIETEQKTINAKLDTITKGADYFTVLAYCKLNGVKIDMSNAATIGKTASKVCRDNGWMIGKAPDFRFGTVNTYPADALDQAIM